MARAKIVTDGDGKFYGIRWNCPGCALADDGDGQMVLPVSWTPPGMERSPHIKGDGWSFNGNMELPTFKPSVLTRVGHYQNPNEAVGNCACDFQQRFPNEDPWPWPCLKCHSFITDGRIQFLDDCTHPLRGQTVDLPELEAD